VILVAGYRLATDRAYDPETHVWVKQEANGRVRIGLDPLGIETMGTLAQLDLWEPGATVARGEPAGTLEAEKFVGPLACPISGTVVAVNAEAVADPRRVHADPFATWLLEVQPADYAAEATALVAGDDVAAWFEAKVADYRRKGVLAE
jgi:glycine cleavage system H protein